jgi:hypothetical protein
MNNTQEKKEEYIMSKLNFRKEGVLHTPLKSWQMREGTHVAIYQGNRGSNPELDYVIKYLAPNKRLRAPSHTHWIVDLLIKAQFNEINTLGFVNEWIRHYDMIEPFASVEERNNYELVHTNYFVEEYELPLNRHGAYSVEFLSTIIELFIKCEKQSTGAFMFKDMLVLMKDYCEGKKDFYQIISHSKRV